MKSVYKISRLPSGVTLATAEMPYMSSASLGIWVNVGGRYEPAPLTGVSHFIEHMVFKGTRRRTSRDISQDVEGVGGYLNAFTTEECTCFYAKAGNDRMDQIWDVLADMFLNSTFDAMELEKERNVIREELAMYLDQPQHHVQDLLNDTLWPQQPLGRPLTGTEETLALLRRTDLISYKQKNYLSGATLIALAGNLRHSAAAKAVSRAAAHFKSGQQPKFLPAQSAQNAPRLRSFRKETEQTQLALGIRTCSRHDPRRFAVRLLNAMLGENMSSRLFQVVREENGLAYSICSSLSFYDDVGVLTISAGVETDKMEKALKLIIGELAIFISQAPSRAEVRRARDYIFGQLDLSLENTENQMMWLAEHYLGYGRIVTPDEVKERVAQVTPAQIQAVAQDFLRPENLSLALVSPLRNTQAFLPILSKICV